MTVYQDCEIGGRVLRPEWSRCQECGCVRPRRGGYCLACGAQLVPMLGRIRSIQRLELAA